MSAEFTAVTEVDVDTRCRVSLGRAGVKPGTRFRIAANADGVLMLTPLATLTVQEMRTMQERADTPEVGS